MPVEIKVGPPVLTINQGTVFMVTDERGEINGKNEHGIFAGDTRLISHLRQYINGVPWTLLTSATVQYYALRIELTNPALMTDLGPLAAGQVGLTVRRRVTQAIHEDLDLVSYADRTIHFQLEIALRSDFADIFEVRGHQFARRGNTVSRWNDTRHELSTTYTNADFHRGILFQLVDATSRPELANGRIVFDVTLEPGQSWHACACYHLDDGRGLSHARRCRHGDETDHELGTLQAEWKSVATALTSSNEHVYRAFTQSVEDMGALRLHEQDLARNVWVPAAGVPWYVALFGRDSLIVSLQNMIVSAPFARGALQRLAEYQATTIDDWRDAEPGKIPHELRVGELAYLHKVPHTPYYGTADATILYPIVLHEAWKWTGDEALLSQHLETAQRCLEWMDTYGDFDRDGFQEYRRRSAQGYENMGWKDSGDAVVYPDGSQVKQPKALVELQGYAFDARMRMAEVFDALGEPERAAKLRTAAAELRRRFEEAFWCEELGFYAFGLGPDKQPIATMASNAGHCLWSGLPRPDRAARVARRFMEPNFWSGWGIRTLPSDHPAYNPYSYHRGSVWPHDNALIALGFKRYGFVDECARVARDVFRAAGFFAGYRLPELYAGLPRQDGSFPVQYLGANIPQAWAAGSIFQLVQAMLGLRADAPARRLYVHPTLPTWLPDVQLHGLQVGRTKLTLRFRREDDAKRCEVMEQDGPDIDMVEEAWAPWMLAD
ncbi:MAG: amylo-alpha-1,6-glucosidase [Chloroflexota bacterium]|nr:amylo-alpha-1,6-glucosidase [Chloroflexota bacterium]